MFQDPELLSVQKPEQMEQKRFDWAFRRPVTVTANGERSLHF